MDTEFNGLGLDFCVRANFHVVGRSVICDGFLQLTHTCTHTPTTSTRNEVRFRCNTQLRGTGNMYVARHRESRQSTGCVTHLVGHVAAEFFVLFAAKNVLNVEHVAAAKRFVNLAIDFA